LYYAAGVIMFISETCCNKQYKPGLGQGFHSRLPDGGQVQILN